MDLGNCCQGPRLRRIVTCIGPNQKNQPNLDLYLVRRYKICHFPIMVSYLCIGQNQKNLPNLVLYLVRRSKIFVSVRVRVFDQGNLTMMMVSMAQYSIGNILMAQHSIVYLKYPSRRRRPRRTWSRSPSAPTSSSSRKSLPGRRSGRFPLRRESQIAGRQIQKFYRAGRPIIC